MEEIQKKTTKTAKKTDTKKTAKMSNKSVEKKPAKTANKSAEKKPAKTANKSAEKKPAKTANKSAEKKTTKTVKTVTEKKTTKPVKKVAEKKTTNVVKKEVENKPAKTVDKVVKKKPAKAVKKPAENKTIKTVDKVAEKKQDETIKEKSKGKKYIYVSIGSIICILVILGLLILNIELGMHAYNVMKKNEETNSDLEFENNSNTAQEIGNVLSTENEMVDKIIKKITFSPNVTASIYNAGAFDADSIQNDLKLKIGWGKTKDENKLKSINQNNEQIEALEKETMEEAIKKIFGPDAKFTNESFDYTKVSTFALNDEKTTYSNGLYTRTIKQAEEEVSPLIYQEVQKVVKYSKKVMVYVKAAYMDVEEGKYVAYKKWENGEFAEKLLEITPEELFSRVSFNQYTGEGALAIDTNVALDSIRSKLDTYKYTFTFDEDAQEYYLSGFNRE